MKIEKTAFITRGSELSLLELAAQLKQKRGIETTVRQKALLVDQKDYHTAISVGATIAINTMLNDMLWVDANEKTHKIGLIPVMHIVETPTGTDMNDKTTYLRELKEYCGTEALEIEETVGGFDVLMYKPFTWHDLMIKRCMGFNYVYGKNPFYKILYPTLDNSYVVNQDDLEKELERAATSYIESSLLHDLIKYPIEKNIAPHNDDIYKIRDLSRLSFSDFSIKDIAKESCTYKFKGHFKANSFSPNSFLGKCDTTDSGQYESTLSMTRDGVTITTNITASRKITGNVFLPTYFDNFFPGLAAHNEVETKSITEHFVKIAGGKRLLHFSDEYDFFEIFDLPDKWIVERGLYDLPKQKVFDDISFDTEDPDLNEAKKIIEEAKKKAKVLVAKLVE